MTAFSTAEEDYDRLEEIQKKGILDAQGGANGDSRFVRYAVYAAGELPLVSHRTLSASLTGPRCGF